MPDETKTTDPKTAATKIVNDKPQMPAKAAPAYDYKVETDPVTGEERILTGNFTRDAIVLFQRGKFMEQGKSADEALELAVKRGYEMVKDPPAKPAA
jgi:hypothetical protein